MSLFNQKSDKYYCFALQKSQRLPHIYLSYNIVHIAAGKPVSNQKYCSVQIATNPMATGNEAGYRLKRSLPVCVILTRSAVSAADSL